MNRPALRLLRLVAPFSGWMALAAALGTATVASSVGLMAASALLIAWAALQPSIADLAMAIVGVRFFGLARGVFRYLERYVSHSVNFRLLARLRVWFYQALEPLAPARLIDHRSGDLLARVVADIETLQDFYVRVIAPPVVAVLIALLMVAGLGLFHPALAAVLLGFVGLGALGQPLLMRALTRGPGLRQVTERAALHAALVDTIQGLPDLAANGQTAAALARLDTLTGELDAVQRRLAWVTGLQSTLGSLLTNTALWALLVMGVALVSDGRLNGLYLAVVTLGGAASLEAVLPLPLAAQALETALAAARRLFAVADAAPAVTDPAQVAPAPRSAALEVRGLSFTYPGAESPALRDVSFDLPPGKRLAIVGPSGSGKTTLLSVLLRFWDCPPGQVWWDGRDARAYAAEDVRRLTNVVAQPTHLFNGTLAENLRVAQPAATDAELVAAAQRAQLHEFIEALPERYGTWIGERGVRLSGGQRQRLALARALLRASPLLVLDEPTASLDPATERAVLQTLFAVGQGRSLLLVTHRLIGLDALDEILVLDQGRVVQRGRHAELIAVAGLYQRLWRLQQGG